MSNLIALALAYLLGSLSSAILVSKFLKLPDPREQGSGNAGATNILRLAGRNTAIVVLLGDILKGALAVIIARTLGVSGVLLGFVALSAVMGHIFPLYFKFKGGKGVATMMGAVAMLSLWVGLLGGLIFAGVAYLTRYASLGSLVAVISTPILMLLLGNHLYTFPVFLTCLMVIWSHRENISRLKSGIESKF